MTAAQVEPCENRGRGRENESSDCRFLQVSDDKGKHEKTGPSVKDWPGQIRLCSA